MATINIPDELASEIDRVIGSTKRSDFAVNTLWREIQRTRQRDALKATRGAWSHEDHPELADGGGPYVEQLRSEPDERFDAATGMPEH